MSPAFAPSTSNALFTAAQGNALAVSVRLGVALVHQGCSGSGVQRPRGLTQLQHHGGVVAGLRVLAWRAVDVAGRSALAQGFADQNVVDAQAAVLLEAQH